MKTTFMKFWYIGAVTFSLICSSHMSYGFIKTEDLQVLDYSDIYFEEESTQTSTNTTSDEVTVSKGSGSKKKGCPKYLRDGGEFYLKMLYEENEYPGQKTYNAGVEMYEDHKMNKYAGSIDAGCEVSSSLTEKRGFQAGICVLELVFVNADGTVIGVITAAGVTGQAPIARTNAAIIGGALCAVGVTGMLEFTEFGDEILITLA